MTLLSVVPTLSEAIAEIKEKAGAAPILIATDAGNDKGRTVPYPFVREMMMSHQAVVILFGTAWGIAKELIRDVDYILEPIMGVSEYNHLSVRTAAAITLDRLLSKN